MDQIVEWFETTDARGMTTRRPGTRWKNPTDLPVRLEIFGGTPKRQDEVNYFTIAPGAELVLDSEWDFEVQRLWCEDSRCRADHAKAKKSYAGPMFCQFTEHRRTVCGGLAPQLIRVSDGTPEQLPVHPSLTGTLLPGVDSNDVHLKTMARLQQKRRS